MILSISSAGSPSLIEPGNFSAFCVEVPRTKDADWARDILQTPFIDDNHVWVSVELIQNLAAKTPDFKELSWQKGFLEMVEFAKSKGWMDSVQKCIHAHIEIQNV